MPSNLASFGLPEMLRCSMGSYRGENASAWAPCVRVCRFSMTSDYNGGRARLRLMRFYKTIIVSSDRERSFARALLSGDEPKPDMRCLT